MLFRSTVRLFLCECRMTLSTSNASRSTRPRLLVSVRDAREGEEACAGGCDIVDVKEPARGALGMADYDTLRQIAHVVAERARPLSVALGDFADWVAQPERLMQVLPTEAERVAPLFWKLGTSTVTGTVPLAWHNAWRDVARAWGDAHPDGVNRFILVAYADFREACAPSPAEVWNTLLAGLDEGRNFVGEHSLAGLLIDTYRKDGRTLLDHMSPAELRRLVAEGRSQGYWMGLAGSLRAESCLELARAVGPDVLGVRGAACADGSRRGVIDRACVHFLRTTLDRLSEPEPPQRSHTTVHDDLPVKQSP